MSSQSKYNIIGFFLFFLTISFNCIIAIIVYERLKNSGPGIATTVIVIFMIFSALTCSIIDVIRRKLMIDKPVREIRIATKKITRGDFNINLKTSDSINNYTMYDKIKMDLNALALELSKNEVLKTDFIANVSHELKTPLSVIQNYSKALENEKLDNEIKKKYLHTIQDASKKLNSLVTNILKLNKLENQELVPEYKNFNLSESIANSIIQYESLIDKKNIELDCDIEEDILIHSEESYLEIIWFNLISNAIKFTDSNGKISISLKKDINNIIFKISDTGCGMSKETGMRIFDKFYQGDTSHHKEGNGLGLALVKKVIDILGGQLNVESEVGVGTTFTVILKEK